MSAPEFSYHKTPKLLDSAEHGERSELFIVEGDSAASTIRICRNREIQAVLPMQGKVMNAHKASAKDLVKNPQIRGLLDALQADLLPQPLRAERDIPYSKLILLFDPDPDGIHARTLMLFFLDTWFRHLLDQGRVFDVHAPQWKITGQGLNTPRFAGTPSEMRAMRTQLEGEGITQIQTQRFRGLGSIDGEIIETQCVNPNTRLLYPLSHSDALAARAMMEELSQLGDGAVEY